MDDVVKAYNVSNQLLKEYAESNRTLALELEERRKIYEREVKKLIDRGKFMNKVARRIMDGDDYKAYLAQLEVYDLEVQDEQK